jgi:guanylate kinase
VVLQGPRAVGRSTLLRELARSREGRLSISLHETGHARTRLGSPHGVTELPPG